MMAKAWNILQTKYWHWNTTIILLSIRFKQHFYQHTQINFRHSVTSHDIFKILALYLGHLFLLQDMKSQHWNFLIITKTPKMVLCDVQVLIYPANFTKWHWSLREQWWERSVYNHVACGPILSTWHSSSNCVHRADLSPILLYVLANTKCKWSPITCIILKYLGQKLHNFCSM